MTSWPPGASRVILLLCLSSGQTDAAAALRDDFSAKDMRYDRNAVHFSDFAAKHVQQPFAQFTRDAEAATLAPRFEYARLAWKEGTNSRKQAVSV